MSDFTVSARLEGDADDLVDALAKGDKAAEDFTKRQEERARRTNQYTIGATQAERQRTEALGQSTKAAEATGVANDNAADAAARLTDKAKAMGEQVGKAATELAAGRVAGGAFMETLAGITRSAVALGGPIAGKSVV